MTTQSDIAKDFAITLLSTSGLLLTLLVGFVIAASVPTRPSIMIGSILFVISASLSVLALEWIIIEADDRVSYNTQIILLTSGVIFCAGLGTLVSAILPL